MQQNKKVLQVVGILMLSALLGSACAGGEPSVGVTQSAVQPAASLADFWAGKARWRLMTPYPGGLGNAPSGQHIVVVDDGTPNGRWYHFHGGGNGTTNCAGGWGTQVQLATAFNAQGVPISWSAPAIVVAPTDGTPWGCTATDGRAFYNPAENKFHFLFQCQERAGGTWNGCHVERAGNNPMAGVTSPLTGGGWIPTGGQGNTGLIITSGSVFQKICQAGDRCASYGTMREEGTFDIFDYDSTNGYSIGFHGFNGDGSSNGTLVRTWARVKDFSHYCTNGSCTSGWSFPQTDSMVDPVTQSWPGNMDVHQTWTHYAAGGAGDIFKEGSFYYYIGEVGDYWCPFQSEACTPPQQGGGRASRWALVMARQNNPASWAWDWTSLARRNPVFLSPINWDGTLPPWIQLGYPHIFKKPSDGTIWLSLFQPTQTTIANFLFKLVKTDNRLVNGDFSFGAADGWTRWRSTMNMAVFREPWNTTDGNSYMSVNCNGTCQPGDSVYQDVADATLAGRTVSFGGKLRASFPATAQIALFEFNASGVATGHSVSNTSVGTSWQSFSGSFIARADTTKIRLQVYLSTSNQNLYLDEMFVSTYDAADEQ